MGQAVEQPEPFEFSGGALCLDFANTLGDRPCCTSEKLVDPADFLRWAGEAGILGDRRLRATPAALRRVVRFREVLYRIFASLAAGDRAAAEDLDELNRTLAVALRHSRLEPAEDGFGWAWTEPPARMEDLLWPVARSAADLLTSAETPLLRECGSETCSWLFVDRSRTHRRRWCDMKTCGNRAKARRHYQKKKGLSSSAPSPRARRTS